ncbi:MAG: lactate utilization protein [Bacillota bacterium]|nr:lactate utilization protein [Bacillota bacterium]
MIKIDNIKKANKVKIETLIKALEKRGMKGYYAANGEEALNMILDMIPEGSSVGRGGSETLNSIGVFEALHKGNYKCLEPHGETDPERKKQVTREIFSADYMLTSANAITMDGHIVNIDGTGNRMAAVIWGPDKVIYVVGANKIVGTLEEAEGRIKSTACPPNCIRLGKQTPCALTGKCGNCLSPGNTVCCNTVVTRYNSIEDRIHVILVNENLGF